MMSRRKTLPSLSSSRQMMMAWKVSGLSHRPAIIASLGRLLGLGLGRDLLLNLDQLAALALALFVGLLALLLSLFARLLGLDHVDAHLAEHREDILDLLGIDLFRQRVDLIMGDVAALLGGADELLDGRVGEVAQRQRRVRRLGPPLLRHPVLLRRHLGTACHESPQPAPSPRRGTPPT